MSTREKRGHGEGGKPRQRKDGRWQAEVTVGYDAKGQQIRKSVYGSTATECRKKARELLREVEDGTVTIGKSPTFEEWCEHWITNIADLKYNTEKGYRSLLRNWIIEPGLGRKKLSKLTPEDFDRVYQLMREEDLSESYMLHLHRMCSRALKVAVQRQKLGVSPLDKIDAPTKISQTPFKADFFSLEETRKLIQTANELDLQDAANWEFALANGPRPGERQALGWDMVDIETGKIRIERALVPHTWEHGCDDPERCPQQTKSKKKEGRFCPYRHSGGLYIETPKSKAGDRPNMLPKPLLEKFKALRRRRDKLRAALGDDYPTFIDPNGVEVDLVFAQEDGRPLHPSTDRTRWEALLASAGLSRRRRYDARHTAATTHLLLGTDPRVVMDMFGWSQESMLRRYQHVVDDLRQEAAANVAGALWADPAPPAPEPDPAGVVVDFQEKLRQRKTG